MVVLTLLAGGFIFLASTYCATQGFFATPSFLKEILIFLALSTILLYGILVRTVRGRPIDFVTIYLGMTVLRILFFGAFIFIVIKIDTMRAFENTVLFLVSYFLFTGIEVATLFVEINSRKTANRDQKDL